VSRSWSFSAGWQVEGAETKNWITILVDKLFSRSFQETPRISTGIYAVGAGMSEKPA
jgi:hypothetical protein